MAILKSLQRPLIVSAVLALAVTVGLTAYGDASRVLQALRAFHWPLLVPVFLLTTWNYVLRWVKWHFYLRVLGIRPSRADSVLVFLAGFSMALTPAKLGEWIKSLLLRQMTGAPISRTAPIIVAERLSDGLAVLLLAAGGIATYRLGWQMLGLFLIAGLGLIAVVQQRGLVEAALGYAGRFRRLGRLSGHARQLYESAYTLLQIRNLALAVGLGVVSWAGEGVAFSLVLAGLGIPWSPELLLQSTFILSTAILVGSASMLPGGLGAAEGSIAGLLLLLLALPPEIAVAATFLIRLCTLWLGVSLGFASLLALLPRLTSAGDAAPSDEAEVVHPLP